MAEVQIISRVEASVPGESGVPKPAVAVTYSTQQIPPRTVIVPADQADDAAVAEAIRQDIASLGDGPGETLTV